MPLDRDSLSALKNIIEEVDLILETTPDLPQNRTGRSRELLATALAITGDLLLRVIQILNVSVIRLSSAPICRFACAFAASHGSPTLSARNGRTTVLPSCSGTPTMTSAAFTDRFVSRLQSKRGSRITFGNYQNFSRK